MAKYFKFNAEHIQFGQYSNGRIAISLIDPIEGPMCKATTNVPSMDVPKGYVLIKDYSENEGVLEDLVQAGIIKELGARIPVGMAELHLCKLLVEPINK